MAAAAKETTSKLVEVQPIFRDKLGSSIEAFRKDEQSFVSDYNIRCPPPPPTGF
jgi:hypothetical protein